MKKSILCLLLGVSLMIPKQNFAQAFQDSYEEAIKEMQNTNYAPSEEGDIQLRVLNMDGPVRPEWNEETRKFILHRIKQSTWTSDIIGRSIMYAPFIEKVLIENELPIELSYLCLVESQFNTRTVSYAGAAGLWQLMPETARLMGLKVNNLVDERFDPYKSTEAAVKYLKYLHGMFNDWGLTIAGYNMGPYRINQLLKEGKGTTYWELRQYLPKETQNYVPAYIASNYLMQFYAWHNIKPNLPNLDLQLTVPIRVTEYLTFATISQLTELPLTTIETLNPTYRKNYLPENIDGNYLILPRRVAAEVESYLATPKDSRPNLSNRPILTTNSINPNTYYEKVKITLGSNDNLVNLSKTFNCSASNIRAWNSLSSFYVADGQEIRIFQPRTSFSEVVSTANYAATTPTVNTVMTMEMIAAQEEALKRERINAITKSYSFVDWVSSLSPEEDKVEIKPLPLSLTADISEPPSEILSEKKDIPSIIVDAFDDETAVAIAVTNATPMIETEPASAKEPVTPTNIPDEVVVAVADADNLTTKAVSEISSALTVESLQPQAKTLEKEIVATSSTAVAEIATPATNIETINKIENVIVEEKLTAVKTVETVTVMTSSEQAEIPREEKSVAPTTMSDMATIAAIEDKKVELLKNANENTNKEVTDVQPIKDTFAFTPAVIQDASPRKPTLAIDGFEGIVVSPNAANQLIQKNNIDDMKQYVYHFIGRNETLVDIAEKYENVCVSDILALNQISQSTSLAVGARIKVKKQ